MCYPNPERSLRENGMNEAIPFLFIRRFSTLTMRPHEREIASLTLAMTDLIASLIAHWGH